MDSAAAGGRRINAGQQFQQRALARPVVADDAQPVAFVDRQVDVFQGLDFEGVLLRAAKEALEQIFLQADPAEPPHAKQQSNVFQFNQIASKRSLRNATDRKSSVFRNARE